MVVQSAAEIHHDLKDKQDDGILGLRPSPNNLLEFSDQINLEVLKPLIGSSILTANMFTVPTLVEICKLAALIQSKKISVSNLLHDRILAAAFFEPSTRTRLSFESAMLHLGGKTLSVADAASTGIAKGESLLDIGQMFNSYANVVVVRHPEQRALQELAEYLRIPMINGGNGSDEHPTQAMADWYALLKWKPKMAFSELPEDEKLHIGIIGTPGKMRSVKSFLILALLFSKNIKKITIISEMADPLGEDIQKICNEATVPIDFSIDLKEVVTDLDVIYMNAIALLGDSYRTLGSRFKLNKDTPLKEGAVILHPLARQDELSTDLDNSSHNLYFNQADGAVFVRQAILMTIFDKLEQFKGQ